MLDRNELARNLQVSHSPCKFLQVNHSTYKFLQVNHSTCKFLQVNHLLQETFKILQVNHLLQETCKFLQVNHSVSTRAAIEAVHVPLRQLFSLANTLVFITVKRTTLNPMLHDNTFHIIFTDFWHIARRFWTGPISVLTGFSKKSCLRF